LGVGVASIAVTGWRTSSRKSSQFEAELAGMAQNLKEKEAQLQELKLSEPRPQYKVLRSLCVNQMLLGFNNFSASRP